MNENIDEAMTATPLTPEAPPNVPTTELSEVVYSAESPLRQPMQLVRNTASDLWKYRELTLVLFLRDLRAQYRQSYFGYLWMITPLISTAVVWTFLTKSKAIQVAETPIPYPLYVMLGSMVWGMFTSGVNVPSTSFKAGSSVFMKLKVPAETFILAGLGSQIFATLLRSLVLVPVFIALGVTPATSCWLFPFGLTCALLMGLAIGILLLPVNSLYQDAGRIMGIVLSLAMYATPVVYPPPTSGWGAKIVQWNPMSYVVVTTRDWLTLGYNPDWTILLILAVISMVILFAGLVAFRAVLPRLVERLGM